MALAGDVQRFAYATLLPVSTFALAANQVVKQGSIVVEKVSDGFAYLGVTGTGLKALGVAAFPVDSTGKADGAKDLIFQPGTIGCFETAGGGDTITIANRFATCYIVDDDTVGLTDGGSTRSVAGVVFDVDSDGRVIVQFEVVR